MIEELVDAFSVILQILIVALVALGAYIGYIAIPDSIAVGEEVFHPPASIKLVAGGFIAWLFEVILFGPALVLIDIRNVLGSIRFNRKQDEIAFAVKYNQCGENQNEAIAIVEVTNHSFGESYEHESTECEGEINGNQITTNWTLNSEKENE